MLLAFSPALALGQSTRVDTGYSALAAQLGAALPTGASVAVTQVEASIGVDNRPSTTTAGTGNYAGKTFTFRSPASGLSSHAVTVANNFYGLTSSLSPGVVAIDSYEAGNWLGTTLQTGTSNPPLDSPNRSRVFNHSYTGSGTTNAESLQLLERVDSLVEKKDQLQIVGVNNSANTPTLLSYGVNSISVGVSSLAHGTGTPISLGDNPVYGKAGVYQHPRPDIVAPASATSFATPLVSSAAALLIDASRAHGPGSADPWSTISYFAPWTVSTSSSTLYKVYAADTSEVIRAALMAGADRTFFNSDGTKGLDYRSAGNQSINGLDTRYGAGQLNVRNSYNILAGKQQAGAAAGNGNAVADAGFDYVPQFGGAKDGPNNTGNLTNAIAKYTFTGGWTGQNFSAALVWNTEIDLDQVYATQYDTAPIYRNFNLRLLDITNLNAITEVATSNGDKENTENIFATLVAGKTYQLEVTSPDKVIWDYGLAWNGISNQLWNGTAGNNTWNVANATTWQRGTNTAATFLDHDQVVFNDTAANTTVNIGAAVSPAFVTVDNTTKSYVFGGSAITGGGGLIKQGTNSLTLNNANTYTGDTLLKAGSIRAGAVNALSPNSAIDITAGATLDLLGNANTVKHLTGSGTVQAAGATLGIAPNASATFAGTLVSPAGLNKTLSGTQDFTGSVQWAATNINVQGGILRFNLGNTSTVTLTAGTNVAVQAGATLELAGTKSAFTNGTLNAPVVTNAATAAVSITGTNQIVGPLTGPTTGPLPFGTAVGATTIATGANLTTTRIRQTSLTINGTGKATVVTNGGDSGVSVFGALTLAGGTTPTATLDLKDNDLVIDYTGSVGTLLSTLTAQIKAARNGLDASDQANWTGAGVTSSVLRNVNLGFGSDRYNLGIVNNADFSQLGISSPFTTFSGVPVDTTSILVKYTLNGDANLDGFVTSDDYSFWLQGYLSNGNRGGWMYGDFNYSGTVTSEDYSLWLNSFLSGGGQMTAGLSFNINAVPEPATWGALVSVGVLAWGVKKKKRSSPLAPRQ